jgi:glycosyltransferase involved in cell wall biosynthesis
MTDKAITIAYLGNFDPSYTRVRVVTKGLKKAGFSVIECRTTHHSRFLRLCALALQYARIAKKVDLIMVSEGGQAYVPLSKVLALLTRKPLLVDIFISYFHIHAIDSGVVRPRSLKGRYFYYLDMVGCLLADRALLDAPEHARYFCEEFGLAASKFSIVPVGSDDEIFFPVSNGNGQRTKFRVFLVTSYYPLHGVEHVIRAAKLLESQPDIEFFIVGNGITRKAVEQVAREMSVSNIIFRSIVPSYILPDLMAKSDVCLGQFGDTQHARMVVPAKVYDALAMRKPVITGAGDAVRAVLTNEKDALLIPLADPHALANAIVRLKNDAPLRESIAENGYRLFQERFCLEKIGERLSVIVREMVEKTQRAHDKGSEKGEI